MTRLYALAAGRDYLDPKTRHVEMTADAVIRGLKKFHVIPHTQAEYAAMTPKVAAPPPDLEKPEGAPKEQALGKKDQANVDARTAQVGTDWEDLLRGTPPASVQ